MMIRTTSVIQNLSTFQQAAASTATDATLETFSNMPSIEPSFRSQPALNLQSMGDLVEPVTTAVLPDVSPTPMPRDQLLSRALQAAQQSRDDLGKPINQGLRSLFPRYRQRSAKWLPLRAQRALASDVRQQLAQELQNAASLSKSEKKSRLKSLNKDIRFKGQFKSEYGVMSDKYQALKSSLRFTLHNPQLSEEQKQVESLVQYQQFYNGFQQDMSQFKVAACSEYGFATAHALQDLNENVVIVNLVSKKSPINMYKTSGHVVCLLGVADVKVAAGDGRCTGAKASWGNDFIVVDGWTNDAYHVNSLDSEKPTLASSKAGFLRNTTRIGVRHALESGDVAVLYARAKV